MNYILTKNVTKIKKYYMLEVSLASASEAVVAGALIKIFCKYAVNLQENTHAEV